MSGLDLYLSQRTLALLFVYAAVIGFGLGAVYDGLRVLRMLLGESLSGQGRRPPPLTVLLFFEDVCFMLAATVALIVLGYYANDGNLRAPAVIGLLAGFFVYRHTVSRLLLRVSDALIRRLRRLVSTLARVLVRLAASPLRGLWSLTVGRFLEARRERRTERRIRELTERASRGFALSEEEKTGKHPDPPV